MDSTEAHVTVPPLNQIDLGFVIDTTGSMSSAIQAAKRQMITMLQELAHLAGADLRFAVIEYRDHPPQERTFIAQVAVHLTDDLQKAQAAIDRLDVDGGGDAPEAVFDGLRAAVTQLHWRQHARRIVVLVGDAPPHGVGTHGDAFASGCPCGDTTDTITADFEEHCITLYAIAMNENALPSFMALGTATGGNCWSSQNGAAVMEQIQRLLREEMEMLQFDATVLAARTEQPAALVDDLAGLLGRHRRVVARSLQRLGRRNLLPET